MSTSYIRRHIGFCCVGVLDSGFDGAMACSFVDEIREDACSSDCEDEVVVVPSFAASRGNSVMAGGWWRGVYRLIGVFRNGRKIRCATLVLQSEETETYMITHTKHDLQMSQ